MSVYKKAMEGYWCGGRLYKTNMMPFPPSSVEPQVFRSDCIPDTKEFLVRQMTWGAMLGHKDYSRFCSHMLVAVDVVDSLLLHYRQLHGGPDDPLINPWGGDV